MVAKLGFILLVLAFGLLMFLAGAFSPAGVREPLAGGLARLGVATTGATAASGPAPPAPPPPAPAPAAAPQPPPYQSLLLKEPRSPEAEYGVQVGLFAAAPAAAALTARLQALGLAPRLLTVTDRNGASWSVVAVGPYASAEEAETARATLAQRLGAAAPLAVILLPKPAPTPTAP